MNSEAQIPPGAVERTMSLKAANINALWITPLLIAAAVIPYWLVWNPTGSEFRAMMGESLIVTLLVISLPVGVVVHELLHALGWGMVAGFQNIKFGFKDMTPYTHCTVPIRASAYRFGTVLPGVVLGVLPIIAATLTGLLPLLIFGTVMLMGAAGDILILWMLRDLKGDTRVQDHPSKVGCLIWPD